MNPGESSSYRTNCSSSVDVAHTQPSPRGTVPTIPHSSECFVYRHAGVLLGIDRRGMCTCGATS